MQASSDALVVAERMRVEALGSESLRELRAQAATTLTTVLVPMWHKVSEQLQIAAIKKKEALEAKKKK
jgi:hypothetical protein